MLVYIVCLDWSVFPTSCIVPLHWTTVTQSSPFRIHLNIDQRVQDDKSPLRKFVFDGIQTLDPPVRSLTLYKLSYVALDLLQFLMCTFANATITLCNGHDLDTTSLPQILKLHTLAELQLDTLKNSNATWTDDMASQ